MFTFNEKMEKEFEKKLHEVNKDIENMTELEFNIFNRAFRKNIPFSQFLLKSRDENELIKNLKTIENSLSVSDIKKNKFYDKNQINEIEEFYDYDKKFYKIICDPIYDYREMREIVIGFKEGLSMPNLIKISKEKSWQKMREQRISIMRIEYNLNISAQTKKQQITGFVKMFKLDNKDDKTEVAIPQKNSKTKNVDPLEFLFSVKK